MDHRYRTISISKVGPTTDLALTKIGRGVFNFDSVLDYISHPIGDECTELNIELSSVGWISLFDWWIFTCILHRQLSDKENLRILIDFIGDRASGFIAYSECANYFAGKVLAPIHSDLDYRHSAAVHRVLNFVNSLEAPMGFNNIAKGRLGLAWINPEVANRRGWYREETDVANSVILPRTNVGTKEMCLFFVGKHQIERWRESMADKRVPKAAVFHSEEFWRVLCHELARNVVEHANSPGFITGRVILPQTGDLPVWCNNVYDSNVRQQLEGAKGEGFVELCVSDAGYGIPATIEKSFRERYKERNLKDMPSGEALHVNLLKFAFDELGTSKDAIRSWITDRHALGHMLRVVAKYGGVLTVRSGNAELIYYAESGTFRRCSTQLGFEPQHQRSIQPFIPGTHIQLLIPLKSKATLGAVSNKSRFSEHLPQSFHIDPKHPLGPLVPLRERLDALSLFDNSDDAVKFKKAVAALAAEFLKGPHTRGQLLVFDFSEVDWQPQQFETFLFLMENVLLNRPVLFTQFSETLAEIVNAQEDEDRPTYLPEVMKDEIQSRTLDREFAEGTFLETYSGIGTVVLALGPDEGEYLFGVRNARLRAALLEIINNGEQSTSALCESYGLDAHTLEFVLNEASLLFKHTGDGRWQSRFARGTPDGVDLEVQRLRALTNHFDIVADHCNAWRGRQGQSAKVPERFYLPTEDAVYTEFLESSRILSRERYCMEVAERLIFRLFYGLFTMNLKPHDVDILACSTTPTVMLAEAIRRAWPVDLTEKRPVVIDYGPSLFYGADPASIPFQAGVKTRAVIVHDLIDGGTLSRKLVLLTEKQGIDALFVLSFIRFLASKDCSGNKAKPFPFDVGWDKTHPIVMKPVHSMIGIRRPHRTSRAQTNKWGQKKYARDYVVDPRSLRPVSLRSLRLESGYRDERSLTKRDPYLKNLDSDEGICRLAAGHYVYGTRHFIVVVDVRGVLTGNIGYAIVQWLADVCIGKLERTAPWETNWKRKLDGEVTAIILPLHSQIHYILPGLQIELAQCGRRVPHFFLDATSFGGGVENYHIPYQLQNLLIQSAEAIKTVMSSDASEKEKEIEVKKKQLRILFIDDAVFSSRTIQTVLDSLANHVTRISKDIYEGNEDWPRPVDWIRVFVVLNQLPAATSTLWHQRSSCPASSGFRFDEYAPFIGVTAFSKADCPACKELDHIESLSRRIEGAGATDAALWLKKRKLQIAPVTTEAPNFCSDQDKRLPEPIDVLAPPGGGAPGRYKPLHADSAIWRFYELMHLSYPLGDVLLCLRPARESGIRNPICRLEYGRFRLAVYDWCIHNWHQVRLYHAEDQVLNELKAEIEGSEIIFVEIINQLSHIIRDPKVTQFVKWAVALLSRLDADSRQIASEITLNLDIALTLLFFDLPQVDLNELQLIKYISQVQASNYRNNSFVAILYRRLKKPSHVADPRWALTTIAEICFRGYLGNTPQERIMTDHQLLGRLVCDASADPTNSELRRRLEGCLHSFVAAADNLQPYFDADILSSIVTPAKSVLDWLRLQSLEEQSNIEPLYELRTSMEDRDSWIQFATNCHMAAKDVENELLERLNQLKQKDHSYDNVTLDVTVDPDVRNSCLMTHIPRLLACLSNIALEPAKDIVPKGPSRIVIGPCASPVPHSICIDLATQFGSGASAREAICTSSKIAHTLNDLKEFGVQIEGPKIDSDNCDILRLILIVRVGFQKQRR